ncbi:hypothetical protein ACFVXW_10470 [Streptomyces sp. NPDC058251]|uniref:hypothetical protein n=1 Tax=unclassified Streptomyces TaxID=2593676 RepID=UPI00364AB06F
MDLLPQHDPYASPAFSRDTLGFEVRSDVGHDGMRWITVGPADQPGTPIHSGMRWITIGPADQLGTSIVSEPPIAAPGITDMSSAESSGDRGHDPHRRRTAEVPAHDAGGSRLAAIVTDPRGNVPHRLTADERRPPLAHSAS